MTDFVIVAAALASIASATPAAPEPQGPTVGFRTYPTAEACETATATLGARAGTRLVCVPVEPVREGSGAY